MKRLLILWLALMPFCSCNVDTSDQSTNPLHKIADDYYAWTSEVNPFAATARGIKKYNGQVPEVSIEAIMERKEKLEKFLSDLEAIGTTDLSTDDKILHAMLELEIRKELDAIEYKDYLIPLDGSAGFITSLLLMPDRTPFETVQDYDYYLQRLEALPDYLNGQREMMEIGLEEGYTLPSVLLENVDQYIPTGAEVASAEGAFLKPFDELPAETPPEKALTMVSSAEKILDEKITPAWDSLRNFILGPYKAGARTSIGISSLPNGKASYESKTAYFTTLDISPDEIYELGLKEVARIRSEMDSVIRETGFEGNFDEFIQFLRTDERFYARKPEELLSFASWVCKRIDRQLPKYFGKLPRLTYGVEPVPEAIAPYYTTGRYIAGSIEDNRAGEYWVNTYDLPSRPLYAIPALSLHEAVPGHHLHFALSQELEGRHDFQRNTYLSAFGEGWALYCEKLGVEMGIYRNPYEHFGRLSYEMWRACRLVVDVGMHYKGWSRDRAVDFMASNTALSILNVNTEIDRYIGWPAQALSYKMGELKIVQLRNRAEEKLGQRFDLRAFHDLVLSDGSVPLTFLEEKVDAYIEGN